MFHSFVNTAAGKNVSMSDVREAVEYMGPGEIDEKALMDAVGSKLSNDQAEDLGGISRR